MRRNDVVLAVLASRPELELSPVQVQKLFFLIDKNIPDEVGGPLFDFEPYDFGPFDKQVYAVLEGLGARGLVRVRNRHSRNRTYAITDDGLEAAKPVLRLMRRRARNYIGQLLDWMVPLGFDELVKAIYDKYPDMKKNSIYRHRGSA